MLISKFLPNPAGKDTDGEWMTLRNDGTEQINLKNWQIQDASGKTFTFSDQILGPKQELALPYSQTKIQINNNGETLLLFNPENEQVDVASYTGSAKDDVIFVRTENGAFQQSFLAPERKAESEKEQGTNTQIKPAEGLNTIAEHLTANTNYTITTSQGFSADVLFIGVAVAVLFAVLMVVLAKKHKLLED